MADMQAKKWDEDDESFQRPDDEAVAQATEKTRLALEKITHGKVSSALPVRHAEKQAPDQYIRYTPSQQAGNHAAGNLIKFVKIEYFRIAAAYHQNGRRAERSNGATKIQN